MEKIATGRSCRRTEVIIIIHEFHCDASLEQTSGPLCVTYYTTAVMSMLLWPIVCVAVWSATQLVLVLCGSFRIARRQSSR